MINNWKLIVSHSDAAACPWYLRNALDDFLLPKPKILKPLPPATAAAVVLPEDQGYRNRYNLIDRPSGNGNFGEKNKGL